MEIKTQTHNELKQIRLAFEENSLSEDKLYWEFHAWITPEVAKEIIVKLQKELDELK